MNKKWAEKFKLYKEGDKDVEEFLYKYRERLYLTKRRKKK